MDEVIDKNRKSCHYDDPDYDFEGWIKNKLPKLKPGEKDCHMYKHWQVWSGVRHFTDDEWNLIPDNVKKYLGKPEGENSE